MNRRLGRYVVILLGLLTPGCGRAQELSPRPTIDGAWWRAATPDHRYGFVAGVADCYFGEYGGRSSLIAGAYAASRTRVDSFYLSGVRDSVQVLDALVGARSPAQAEDSTSRQPRGHSGKGALFLQEVMSEGPNAAAGYVDGYVTCVGRYVPALGRAQTIPTSEYLRQIGQWYRWDENGDADSTRENQPVADVIRRAAAGPEGRR